MTDSRDDKPAEYEIPKDNDGRLLFLGFFAGFAILALLFGAGYGVISMVMNDDDEQTIAADDPAPEVDEAPADASVPVTPSSVAPPPNELVAAADSQSPPVEVTEESLPPTVPESEVTPGATPAETSPAVETEPQTQTPPGDAVAAVTPPATSNEQPKPEEPALPTESTPPAETETPPANASVETEPAPVKPAPPARGLPPTGKPLVYQWAPGEIHSYQVTLSSEKEGQNRVTTTGNVELTVQETQPRQINVAENKDDDDEPETGTGTGFVVSADGHLVTCAHVIQGATRIEVQVGGRKFEASVVAVEPDDDLALLRIDAQDLTPLSLANSDEVKLGEEIRAVGFPLSTVLGNGVKATSGTIAGIVQREDGKRLQVDAAINPGNSGGPIVNTRGQVLGVASSKLVGLELTGVGFCVPSERVKAMLSAHQVQPIQQQRTEPLDGPALVASVTPSVALITVSASSVKATGRMMVISTSGTFRTKNANNDPRRRGFNPFASLSNTTFDRGQMVVDSNGRVGSFESPNQLPFLAGPMGLLAIHPFDSSGRSGWTVREQITVTIQENDNRFGPGMPRIPIPRLPRGFGGPRGLDPFNRNRQVKKLTALEVHQYRIKSDSEDEVVLEKTFSLTTLDDDTNPYFQITGTGEVKFSRLSGLVDSFTFNHNFTQNGGGNRVHVPVKIKVERESSEVVAARKRDAAVKQAKAEWEAANKQPEVNQKSPDEVLDGILASLEAEQQKERGNVRGPIGQLAKLKVIPERQDEVEQALLKQIASNDHFTRKDALAAIRVWGTSESIPDLVGLLSNRDRFAVTGAISALGAIGDPSVAPTLLDKAKDFSVRRDCQQAIAKLGPSVEKEVLARMEGADRNTVQMLCDILGQVGGEESLKVLEEMAAGGDFFRKTYANRVIGGVRKRVEAQRLSSVPEGQTLTNADLTIVAALEVLNDDASEEPARMQAMADLVKIQDSEFQRDEVQGRLVELLEDPSKSIREQATRALLIWGTEDSAPALLQIALQADSPVRTTALQALSRYGTTAESALLVDLLADPNLSTHVLPFVKRAGLDDAGQQQLGAILEKDMPPARKRSLIDLLGEVGTPACLVSLDAMANAPQASTLQYTAAKAAAKVRLRAGIAIES